MYLCDTSGTGPSMAPEKKKRWYATSNERGRRRREAVKLLNALAAEVGLKPLLAKAAAPDVEARVRLLDPRCQTDGRPERLRAAVEDYLAGGGKFSVPLLLASAAVPHLPTRRVMPTVMHHPRWPDTACSTTASG